MTTAEKFHTHKITYMFVCLSVCVSVYLEINAAFKFLLSSNRRCMLRKNEEGIMVQSKLPNNETVEPIFLFIIEPKILTPHLFVRKKAISRCGFTR